MGAEEIWVLEWSFKQKMFHIDTMMEMVLRNHEAFEENREDEYLPIAFFRKHEEASKYADELLKQELESAKGIVKKSDALWSGDFENL